MSTIIDTTIHAAEIKSVHLDDNGGVVITTRLDDVVRLDEDVLDTVADLASRRSA